ncbi:MAG TPA: DNA-formamidopyrimidine glycosylase family protein [Gemmatimonadales bacterium]|nr:DNA-formamidopyrimidine glycosylase family protein [Gemmatimonadales bacterium]
MPELPDILLYLRALEPRVLGQPLLHVRVRGPALLRTATPPLQAVEGRGVTSLERLGKRIVVGLEGEYFLVVHLMIAGRLHWRPPNAPLRGRQELAAFDFPEGTLLLTEAGSRHRAALHVVRGRADLAAHDPGGMDVLTATPEAFAAALRRESHTLKRALTDPRIFDGIGNAYSDEILHAARLSPLRLTTQVTEAEVARLYEAARRTLAEWIALLAAQTRDEFPGHVTAFRPEMAVHGRYRKPCPVCGAAVQRIRYASNEVNYCARCQTEGRVLADRSMSRLLREDWPRSLDEWEERLGGSGADR